MSDRIDLKTVGAIVGLVAALAGAAGSWYVNSYRIDQLEQDLAAAEADQEKQNEEVLKKIAEVKCFVAEINDIPLPECR